MAKDNLSAQGNDVFIRYKREERRLAMQVA